MSQRPDRGALFVVTGPSGVGKSTLIRRMMKAVEGISFSVSATTRPPRENEEHGVHYWFLTDEEFSDWLGRGAFLEYAKVYDHSYGTPVEPVMDALAEGRSILLDIDLQGARNVAATYAERVRRRLGEDHQDVVSVFILPPSIEVLRERLVARATDDVAIIDGRMKQVAEQMEGLGEFDYLVVNDDVDTAVRQFIAIVEAELLRRSRRQSLVDAALSELGQWQ